MLSKKQTDKHVEAESLVKLADSSTKTEATFLKNLRSDERASEGVLGIKTWDDADSRRPRHSYAKPGMWLAARASTPFHEERTCRDILFGAGFPPMLLRPPC